jgi:hypothetical protein
MKEPTEGEEEFREATEALEDIADETKHERESHPGDAVEVPQDQHVLEPLKGPHHTPVKE